MTSPLIEIRDLQKTYQMGGTLVRALDGVSLTINSGEFVAIMGPSGSGKSTLMHLLGLLDVPGGGSYKLEGEEVSHLSEDYLAMVRSKKVGFVFQQFNLLNRTSAAENVALPALYAEGHLDLARAEELLTKVGLGSRLDHHPSELSGGQQQRVAIARALVNRPQIVFADEPTGNLDSASEKEIMKILSQLNDQGITIVIVTHEPEIAQYVKRVIRMRDGKVYADEKGGAENLSAIRPSDVAAKRHEKKPTRLMSVASAHLRQAFRSLFANKVRTVLSMLGILIGVAAVIAMLAIGAGARDSIEKQLTSLGSNLLVLRAGGARSPGGVSLGASAVAKLTLDDVEDIKLIAGTKKISPTVNGKSQVVYGDRNWNTMILGTGIHYASMRAANPIMGRFFTDEENRQRSRVAVVGTTVIKELFGETSNPIGESILIGRVNFKIIGILPVRGNNGWQDQDDIIVIPIITAMRRLLGKTFVDSIDIEVNDSRFMDQVQTEVLQRMNGKHKVRDEESGSFQVRNMADIQEALASTSRIMSVLLACVASISLLVGGIGIMNIMLVSVTERTREIGLRKALGATRSSIQSQFLIEAVVVSAIGGIMGILLGIGLSEGLSVFAGWDVKVSWESVLVSALFSAFVGIVFGFWPARKASALHPIQALRHE